MVTDLKLVRLDPEKYKTDPREISEIEEREEVFNRLGNHDEVKRTKELDEFLVVKVLEGDV